MTTVSNFKIEALELTIGGVPWLIDATMDLEQYAEGHAIQADPISVQITFLTRLDPEFADFPLSLLEDDQHIEMCQAIANHLNADNGRQLEQFFWNQKEWEDG